MKKFDDTFVAISITYIAIIVLIIIYIAGLKKYIEIPECLVHKLTGFFCPACGGTRAIISLTRGEIVDSFMFNPIIIYSFVFSTIYIITEIINIKLKNKIKIPWKIIIKVGIVVLMLNCIIQNIIIVLKK